IHQHYTLRREVEGLYNFLVHLVAEQQQNIQARDILVMCSDVNIYAPFIDGVFSNGLHKCRYKIADVSVAQGDTMFSALLAILSLKEDDFTAEQILGLLEYTAIKDKLKIFDIAFIRKIVEKSNIKNGIKGNV